MDTKIRENIRIYNERGILERRGTAFHTPEEFAVQNLFYVVWSNLYHCDRRYSVTRKHLDYFSVTIVLRGKMEFDYNGKVNIVGENEAILLDFRKPHHYHSLSDDLEKWEMLFRGNASEAYYRLIEEKCGNRVKIFGKLKQIFNGMMDELNGPLPDDHRISLLIHDMFYYMLTENGRKLSPVVEKALYFIEENYKEPIQISDMAAYVSVSRYYFSRIFHKETGQTPCDYLKAVRINRAKEMLTEKILSVQEIAFQCGFVNASHFTRVFKAETGQTPAAFRNFFNLHAEK